MGPGLGEDAGHKGAQTFFVLFGRPRLLGGRRDERPDAAPRLDRAGALEIGVDAGHGIGVDFQFDGELADGRQLIAGPQPARRHGRPQPAFELGVDGRLVPQVDGDDSHESTCTSTLIQCQVPARIDARSDER